MASATENAWPRRLTMRSSIETGPPSRIVAARSLRSRSSTSRAASTGGGRFRNAQLDGREIRHAIVVAGHRAAGDPSRCHGKIVLQRAGRGADRSRGQAGGDVRQHRDREGGVGGIERGARRRSGCGIGERQQAVRGHEHVRQHQRLAAGAAEADDIPGVVDDVVGSGDQQEAPAQTGRSRSSTAAAPRTTTIAALSQPLANDQRPVRR